MKNVMKNGMLSVLLAFVVNVVWGQFDDLYYEPSTQKVKFSDYNSDDNYDYIQGDETYGTRVHNNTNDYDYDDEYSYATRINRFHRGGGFDYFSPMHCMSSFAFMGGSPWGMGPGFGSSFFMYNNYIDPFWYNGWSWNRWNRMNRWNSWGWNDPFMAWGNPWMYGSGINIGIYNFGGMGMGMGGGFGRWNPMWGYTNPVIVGGGILPGRYTTNPNGYVYGARNTTGGVVSTQGRNASPREMGGLINNPNGQVATPKVMSPRSVEGNRSNRGDIQTRSTGNNAKGIRAGSINEGKATSISNRTIVNTSPRNTNAITSRGNVPVIGGERNRSANRMGTTPSSSMSDRSATRNTNRIAPRNTRSSNERFGTSSRTPATRSGYSPANTSKRPSMGTNRSNMGSSPRTSSGRSTMGTSGSSPRSSGGTAPSRGGSRRGGG